MEMKFLFALLSLIFVLGCVANTGQITNGTSNMTNNTNSALVVEKGDHVYVDYTGHLENGTVFDTSIGRTPLDFDVGAGQMIKGFDSAVIGMKAGEEKTVSIKPEDAYGLPDPANIIEVPVENMPADTKVGDTLYAGNVAVRVIAITNTTFTVDANHFLAGKTLVFDIKIVRIEKAA